MTPAHRLLSLFLFGTLAACGGSRSSSAQRVSSNLTGTQVQGSLSQFYVINAPAGAAVALMDAQGNTVQSGTADSLGGLVFRYVTPGDGYSALITAADGTQVTVGPATVLPDTYQPDPSFYSNQVLPTGPYGHAGYGYLSTRDGTMLSVQVNLPDGPGPFPTVVEYSGYDPSNPTADNFVTGQINLFRLIAAFANYAYVGVNIRGSGCSGGAFDFFERLQSLDGYDAIEVVAAQPWASSVGMVGISYPGISQLFVAQTRPPHLAAITPLSVIDDTFRGTLYPGGMLNNGFAVAFAMERQAQNRWPNPVGADWVIARVNRGDNQCADNQLLRQQNPDLLQRIQSNPYYPAVGNPDYPFGGDALAPFSFVNQINVPVYIAGAWQDDQTGGHWSEMLDQFDPNTYVRVAAYNGTHVDALGPEKIAGLFEFIEFNIARRVPVIPLAIRALGPILYQGIFGASGVSLPPDRFTGMSYDAALQTYLSEDRIHVFWEGGAKPGAVTLGSPEAAAESTYAQWPPAVTTATRWYLQPGGGLDPAAPTVTDDDPQASDAYVYDPDAKPRADFICANGDTNANHCRSEIWLAQATYDWRPLPVADSLSYITDPLPTNLTVLGSGSVDLWLASTADDTDVEVTLTEVRPDGQERYVQNGWLRASQRKLNDAISSELRPRHTNLEVDAAPIPFGQYVLARVALFPFGHVFRAGSRLRISVETPGGNRPLWTFDDLRNGSGIINSIGHSVGRPSSIVLPAVPDVGVPSALPPCPVSLRGQPCRPFSG